MPNVTLKRRTPQIFNEFLTFRLVNFVNAISAFYVSSALSTDLEPSLFVQFYFQTGNSDIFQQTFYSAPNCLTSLSISWHLNKHNSITRFSRPIRLSIISR